MAKTIRVGLLQQRCKECDKEHNLSRFEDLAREAAAQGAQIICAPEGMLDGYPTPYDRAVTREMAEPVDGPAVTKMRELAGELGVHLMAGFTERQGRRLLNSIAVCDPKGKLLGTYAKVHLHSPSGEDKGYDRGREFKVFKGPGVKFGVMICYDRRVVESARVLRLLGADIIFNPAQTARFGLGIKSTHTSAMRAHAYLNRVYLVCVNSAERKGGSMAIAPDGEILLRLGRGEKVAVADLDMDYLAKVRKDEDFILDRVPSAYRILTR